MMMDSQGEKPPRVLTRLTPEEAWDAAQSMLGSQVSRQQYKLLLEPVFFHSWDGETYTLATRNDYQRTWLEQRAKFTLVRLIENSMRTSIKLKVITIPLTPHEPPKLPLDLELERYEREQAQRQQRAAEIEAQIASLNAPLVEKSTFVPQGQETLNPDQVFSTYAQSPCNEHAYTIIHKVLAAPGKLYNPLYLYGGVGTGKTHLLQAMGNALAGQGLKVLFIHAETFTNDLIRALRAQQMEAFRTRYREVQALLIDDIHFVGGKDSTQQELLYTLNALASQHFQVVAAGQCRPEEIYNLHDGLRSRFIGGLALEIRPPDFALRVLILESKAREQGVVLGEGVAELIAQYPSQSARDLLGLLNQVLARAASEQKPVTPRHVSAWLRQQSAASQRPLSLDEIFTATARYHQLSLDDLLSKSRTQALVRARQMAIFIARHDANESLPNIARFLGWGSHSGVAKSQQQLTERLANEPQLRRDLATLRHQLYQNA
jgi:chromosomal replication initiator protein